MAGGRIPTRPRTALTDNPPASPSERRSTFTSLCVGNQPAISERLGSPPSGAVQHRVGIWRPVCTGAVDFQGEAVIVMSSDRTTDCRDSHQLFTVCDAETEFHASRRAMMSVQRTDEFACLTE